MLVIRWGAAVHYLGWQLPIKGGGADTKRKVNEIQQIDEQVHGNYMSIQDKYGNMKFHGSS